MRPIHIIGGGLAGLSLGIGLRRRAVAVTISEAGSYPRHRVCGEFLSGLKEETLKTLGIAYAFSGGATNRDLSWFNQERPLLHTDLPAPVIGLSRWKLDENLAECFAQLGGRLKSGHRVTSEENSPGLVWSSGRVRKRESPWLGLKCHYTDLALESDLEMHLGSAGYLGLARIEDGKVNACGLFHKQAGIKAAPEVLLEAYLRANGLAKLAERLAAAEAVADSQLGVAGFETGIQKSTPSPTGWISVINTP